MTVDSLDALWSKRHPVLGVEMKRIFDLFKVAWNERRGVLYNFHPRRGLRLQESLKWVPPRKVKIYEQARSGDLVAMPKYSDIPMLEFRNSKELETADERVKKVFSLGFQYKNLSCKAYEDELMQKVVNHSYDTKSLEAQIAVLTAKIRYFQDCILKKTSRNTYKRVTIDKLIGQRIKLLKFLRAKDYRKFEWLLEVLDIEYKPQPVPNKEVTREKSITLLAQLKVEQAKEEKIAALKKSLDEKKVPFLEKKIAKLKELKEKEERYNLEPTVTQEDIEDCLQRLEQVKIEVAEKAKRGYKRKIHPYFIEPYDEKMLLEKEKAAEIIREQILHGKTDFKTL